MRNLGKLSPTSFRQIVLGIIIVLMFLALFIGLSKPQETEKIDVAGVQTESSNTPTSTEESTPTANTLQKATLIKVVDGDTITVSINGKNETIRVIGIDTPEVVDPRITVECFGEEASDFAKRTLQDNKTLFLESDPTQGERDKHQRLLRYVWIDDGLLDFGKFMISGGYAYEYTYNTSYKYQQLYKQAEKEAREAKKGLWQDEACVDGGDKDCSDFATQEEAQIYFESKAGSATNNVDRLDSDHDGIACEGLP